MGNWTNRSRQNKPVVKIDRDPLLQDHEGYEDLMSQLEGSFTRKAFESAKGEDALRELLAEYNATDEQLFGRLAELYMDKKLSHDEASAKVNDVQMQLTEATMAIKAAVDNPSKRTFGLDDLDKLQKDLDKGL